MDIPAPSQSVLSGLLLYEYRQRVEIKIFAIAAVRNINQVHPNSISIRAAQHWFNKFKQGNYAVETKKDERKLKVEDNQILAEVNADLNLTLNEYAAALGISQSQISKRLTIIGYTCKRTRWVPHELTELNKVNNVKICKELIEHQKENHSLIVF